MHILKFGGTSVKNAEAITNVISILQRRQEKAVIVVSACSQITNRLTSLFRIIETQKSDQSYRVIQEIRDVHEEVIYELNLGDDAVKFVNSHLNKLSQIVQALIILGEISPKLQDQILSYGEQLSSYLITIAMQKSDVSTLHVDSRDIISTNSNFRDACVDFEQTKINANIIPPKWAK